MTTKKRDAGGQARSGRRSGRSLEEYQRKRDFDRTREPRGHGSRKRRADTLAFVIQKHDASSLHYDLRLELDGVMRSWAVPKGPSLDPADKRLAMQVEDHPMEYNTFEGTIPQGEYGGGTVMLWDRGTYRPDELRTGEDPASAVRRGLNEGKLSFTFHGERLRGSFALVRTQRGERPKWLLIKHRDDDAREGALITDTVHTSVASGRTMAEIAAESDRVWRSNRGGSSGGEERGAPRSPAAQGMIAPMKPTPTDSVPEDGDWTFEPWRGGQRVRAYVTPETAILVDERARDVTRDHGTVTAELVSLAGRVKRPFVLDGEIADDGDGELFHASDLLLDGDDVLMDEQWNARRAALEKLFRRRRLKALAVQTTYDSAAAALRRARRDGWTGLLAHAARATYEPGERADGFLRIAADPLR
jgi:bifunctional non-homologous end joining protein LigD